MQLSTVYGEKSYQKYAVPRKPITAAASAVIGITSRDDILYHNEKPVAAVSLHEALKGLLNFVQETAGDKKFVLVGHIERFDLPILHRVLKEFRMLSEFSRCLSGCMDTLTIARTIIDWKTTSDYKQSTLVQEFLGKTYEAHNSLAIVQNLQALYMAEFCGKFIRNNFVVVFGSHALRSTFVDIEHSKVTSGQMCLKFARSGIGYHHLETACKRDSENGVKSVLTEPCSTGKIIARLVEYLQIKCSS